jgi:hypothetical protein
MEGAGESRKPNIHGVGVWFGCLSVQGHVHAGLMDARGTTRVS